MQHPRNMLVAMSDDGDDVKGQMSQTWLWGGLRRAHLNVTDDGVGGQRSR